MALTQDEIMNPEIANRNNAKEYEKYSSAYEKGDNSVVEGMANCIIKSQELRDLMSCIHLKIDY